jgi:monomeric isocitrate dehydrogenase
LLRADALMFLTPQAGHAQWIAGFILAKRLERVTTRDVVRAYRALRGPEQRRELQEVMESLATMGWLRAEPTTNLSKLPRAWEVNPCIHSIFAARAQQEREDRSQARQEAAENIRSKRRETT